MREAEPSDGAEVAWMSASVAEAVEEVVMEPVMLLLDSVADAVDSVIMEESVMEASVMVLMALSVAVMDMEESVLALLGAALLSLSTTKGGV